MQYKRLEFTSPISPGLLPALNHCLSVLYQQGRGLEEIILNSVQFYFIDFSHALIVSDVADTKEFFTRVRDLSHSCGTSLVMSSQHVADSSQEQAISVLNGFTTAV